MKPVSLTLEQVLVIHRDLIDRYGGSPGIRDRALLLSALAAPRAGTRGEHFHKDLFEMAVAYLYHLVGNHAFVDGNKRVGAVAAYVFLGLNGYELKADEGAFERTVRGVAEGHTDKAAVAAFIRQCAVRALS
jgi:death-on-curing protein